MSQVELYKAICVPVGCYFIVMCWMWPLFFVFTDIGWYILVPLLTLPILYTWRKIFFTKNDLEKLKE